MSSACVLGWLNIQATSSDMSRVSLPVHAVTIAHMCDATVLTIASMAAAFGVYAVLTDSEEEEEEEDEEPRIKRPNRGWLKRRQERGVFEGIFKELRAENLSTFLQKVCPYCLSVVVYS